MIIELSEADKKSISEMLKKSVMEAAMDGASWEFSRERGKKYAESSMGKMAWQEGVRDFVKEPIERVGTDELRKIIHREVNSCLGSNEFSETIRKFVLQETIDRVDESNIVYRWRTKP